MQPLLLTCSTNEIIIVNQSNVPGLCNATLPSNVVCDDDDPVPNADPSNPVPNADPST